jgi:CelD/BcsL family acetyltransferase involved in cellulose biosynthesis
MKQGTCTGGFLQRRGVPGSGAQPLRVRLVGSAPDANDSRVILAPAVRDAECKLLAHRRMDAGLAELHTLRARDVWTHWRQLATTAPPFLSPEFFALVSRFDGSATVAYARDGHGLIGALPLARSGDRWVGLRCDYTPGYDYVGTSEGVDAIWRALLDDDSWNELVLEKLPATSLLASHLPALASAAGCPVVVRLDCRHPYFSLRRFEAALSPKFRTNLQRCARKAGGIELERIVVPDRAQIDEALALEAMAWKSRAGTSIDTDPRAIHFYRVVSRLFGRRGTAALYFLRANGRRIATLFAVEDARTLYALKIGYDPSFANLSPGHLLIWKVAAEAEARGLEELDFVGHEDEWKRKWTARVKEHVSLTIYRDNAIGLSRYALRQLLRPHLPEPLRHSLREMLPRGCQRADIVGTHTLVERVRGRLDRGLGIKTRVRKALAKAPPPKSLGAPSQFAPGDWVQVKQANVIRETLDPRDRTRGLLFAPTQWETTGQVFRVAKRVQRLRDDHGAFRAVSRTVLLEGVDCAGHASPAAGCGRHCPMMYRDEWLEPARTPPREIAQEGARSHARVRSLEEIRAGLDLRGRHHGLTFMPEMARYAGKRFAIANRITRVFEYDRWIETTRPIYILDGLQCTGAVLGAKGPCDRACSLLWSEDWLILDA